MQVRPPSQWSDGGDKEARPRTPETDHLLGQIRGLERLGAQGTQVVDSDLRGSAVIRPAPRTIYRELEVVENDLHRDGVQIY